MTININELRRLAQAATPGPDGVSLNWLKLLQDFQKEANPAVINELLDRLEVAEKDIALKERVIDSLGLALNAAAHERDNLRAKIEAMEKQEPAGYGVLYVEAANGEEDWDSIWKHRVFAEDHVKDFVQAYSDLGESVGAITVVPLYHAPGAKGE